MANPFDVFDEDETPAVTVTKIGDREIPQPTENSFDVFDEQTPEAKVSEKEKVGTLDYLINSFKKGLISSASFFDAMTRAGFGKMAQAELAKTGALTPEQTMSMVYGIGGEQKPMLESALEAVKESQERISPVFEAIGIEKPDLEMPAPGPISQIAGAGVETLADPLAYLGVTGVGKALLAKGVGRAAGEGTTGVAAETGGMLGEEAQRAITGEEGVAGRAIGTLLGATSSAVPRGVVTRTGEDVVSQIMQNRALLKESPEGAEQAYAKGAAKRLLTAATESEGAKELQDLIGQINEASRFVNKNDAPLVIAMADNPVIRQQIQRLAITRPEFRKKVNDLIKAAEGDVERKTGFLFGERYAADIPEGAQISIANVARQRQNIDKRLNNAFSFVRPFEDTEDFGKRIESLVEQKKKLARQEVSPEYDALLDEARRQDIRMPEEGTKLIYDFVRDNNIRDIFGRGTPVDRKVMAFLRPQDVEEAATPRILGPEGTPISDLPVEQVQYPTLSFDNVESLKKEINLIKRKPLTDAERRKISDLEKIVDEARDTIPGNFSERLKDIDRKYYQKVGVPFSEQGIKEIDSKRYAEQIAPVIVKNAESYRQFVRAVGEEQGNVLAERAILNELYEKAAKGGGGLLSPTAVAKYVRDKGEIIDSIPGLKEKLQRAVVDDTQLRAELASFDKAAKEAQKRISDNYLTQTEFPDYESLSRNFMRNPKARAKLLRDIGDLDANTAKAVRNSLRAEIINMGRKQGNLLGFISAPENKTAIEQAFGPGFQPALRKIALFGDKVSSADVSRLGTQIPKENMDVVAQVFPGLDVPYLSSNFRDRITSLPQKIIRVLSKYNSARLQIATDDAIEELLLDPNGVKKLANTISDVNFKFDNPVALNKLAEAVSQSVPMAAYDAFKVTMSAEQQERLQREAREKEAGEIVFGGFEDEEPKPQGFARGGPVRYTPQEEMLLRKYAKGGIVSNPTVPSEEPEGEERSSVARFLESAAKELPSAMLENVRGYSDLAAKYLKWKFGAMPVEDQLAFAKSLPEGLRQAAVNAIQSAKDLPEKVRTATPEQAGEFAGQFAAGELTDPFRVGRAARAVTKPDVQKIFVGEKSKTWDAVASEQAKELEKLNFSPEEIWQKTGTFRGPDGKWRQEISDLSAEWKGTETQEKASKMLEHPELYSAYPDVASIPFKVVERKDRGGQYAPSIEGLRPESIEVDPSIPRTAAIHELQHAIQEREGFSPGGGPFSESAGTDFRKGTNLVLDFSEKMDKFRELKKMLPFNQRPKSKFTIGWYNRSFDIDDLFDEVEDKVADPAIKNKMLEILDELDEKRENIFGTQQGFLEKESMRKNYMRLAGEAEARAAESRAGMTPEQRRAKFPIESYDLPINQLIIKKNK